MDDRVTVTVQDDQLPRIDELADRLRAVGMRVDQVLHAVGVITGSVPSAQRVMIETVPGVAAVEDETTFQLPPPDAEISSAPCRRSVARRRQGVREHRVNDHELDRLDPQWSVILTRPLGLLPPAARGLPVVLARGRPSGLARSITGSASLVATMHLRRGSAQRR